MPVNVKDLSIKDLDIAVSWIQGYYMLVNIEDLSIKDLDIAVGISQGFKKKDWSTHFNSFIDEEGYPYQPSTSWIQGGPIIEKEKISTLYYPDKKEWYAGKDAERGYGLKYSEGFTEETPLVAAMRCYVYTKIGVNINLLQELADIMDSY